MLFVEDWHYLHAHPDRKTTVKVTNSIRVEPCRISHDLYLELVYRGILTREKVYMLYERAQVSEHDKLYCKYLAAGTNRLKSASAIKLHKTDTSLRVRISHISLVVRTLRQLRSGGWCRTSCGPKKLRQLVPRRRAQSQSMCGEFHFLIICHSGPQDDPGRLGG